MNNSHAFLWPHGDLVTKAWLDVNSRPSEGGTVCRVFNAQNLGLSIKHAPGMSTSVPMLET